MKNIRAKIIFQVNSNLQNIEDESPKNEPKRENIIQLEQPTEQKDKSEEEKEGSKSDTDIQEIHQAKKYKIRNKNENSKDELDSYDDESSLNGNHLEKNSKKNEKVFLSKKRNKEGNKYGIRSNQNENLNLPRKNVPKVLNLKNKDLKPIRKICTPFGEEPQDNGKKNIELKESSSEKTEDKPKPIKFNKDNCIKKAMKALFRKEIYLEILGDITFKKFNSKDFIKGTIQNKLILRSKVYQILGFKEGYRKLIECDDKPEKENEKFFNFFMTRSVGFLFEKYFLDDRCFEIEGKNETIENFKTLKDEIERLRKEVYNECNEDEREKKINQFIYGCYLVFTNFKDCETRERDKINKYNEIEIKRYEDYLSNEKNKESTDDNLKKKKNFLI